MIAPRLAITDRIGLMAASSLALGPGITDLAAFTARLITISIFGMVIVGLFHHEVRRHVPHQHLFAARPGMIREGARRRPDVVKVAASLWHPMGR